MPHVGLLVSCECLSMPQDVHSMLGTGQHDVHSVGCLQEANRPVPAYYSRLTPSVSQLSARRVQAPCCMGCGVKHWHCSTQAGSQECLCPSLGARYIIASCKAVTVPVVHVGSLVIAHKGQDDDGGLLSLEVVHCGNPHRVFQADLADTRGRSRRCACSPHQQQLLA